MVAPGGGGCGLLNADVLFLALLLACCLLLRALNSQCLPEWSKSTQTELCTKCASSGSTLAIFLLAIVAAMVVFSFLVWDNLDGARDMIPKKDDLEHSSAMPFHSIAIRIVSSYLQVSGMLLRFDLTLPKAVQALVQVSLQNCSACEMDCTVRCLILFCFIERSNLVHRL